MGDFSLMVGDPGDAFLHYCAAIDIARANADNLWLAAALEGVTAAEAYAAYAAQDELSGALAPKVSSVRMGKRAWRLSLAGPRITRAGAGPSPAPRNPSARA